LWILFWVSVTGYYCAEAASNDPYCVFKYLRDTQWTGYVENSPLIGMWWLVLPGAIAAILVVVGIAAVMWAKRTKRIGP